MTLAEQFRQEGEQKGRQEGLLLGLEQGMEKGMERGKLEGKTEALKTFAFNLFEQGMTIAQIAKFTGLSVWDVEQLKIKTANQAKY
jgi:predicted transposase YdaD